MIRAEHLTYAVGDKTILDDIAISIAPASFTAILGPNGSGKSTLLKCLTGAQKPSNGSVMLEGKPLSDYALSTLARKRAVLSQSTLINFPFTVSEIVMMGRNPYVTGSEMEKDNDVVQAALESVDAWHLKDRVFPTLSGGEQQRVHLARVLAQIWEQENPYLFLDEPTSALDLKHQHLILAFVKALTKTGAGVVTILHDINLAATYADNIVLLKEGRVFAAGSTADTLSQENIMTVFEVDAEITASLYGF